MILIENKRDIELEEEFWEIVSFFSLSIKYYHFEVFFFRPKFWYKTHILLDILQIVDRFFGLFLRPSESVLIQVDALISKNLFNTSNSEWIFCICVNIEPPKKRIFFLLLLKVSHSSSRRLRQRQRRHNIPMPCIWDEIIGILQNTKTNLATAVCLCVNIKAYGCDSLCVWLLYKRILLKKNRFFFLHSFDIFCFVH